MNYWLNLYTGSTWAESRQAGSNIAGFREAQRAVARRVQPGDIFLCYVTGVQLWVGALEVVSQNDAAASIWSIDDFPVQFTVKPLIVLPPEQGIPMGDLKARVSFYHDDRDRGLFRGFVRSAPAQFKTVSDAELIMALLREASSNPVVREVDARKLARKPYYVTSAKRGAAVTPIIVSIPESEIAPSNSPAEPPLVPPEIDERVATTRHTEIQYELLRLGAEMGLDVWVARNDRSRSWQDQQLGTMPRMLSVLPVQFNEATNRTIELIDVLWLRNHAIAAAFEVECTTSVHSGLLRMSDLLALQPNLDIDLYLVAPDDRRQKVQQEIRRPTFTIRERPLHEACGFLAFSKLTEAASTLRKLSLVTSLKSDFLKQIAEYFTTTSAL